MFEKPSRLHPSAILVRFGPTFYAFIKSAIIPLAATFLSKGGSKRGAGMVALLLAIFTAVIGLLSFLITFLHFLSTRYMIEGDAFVISSGFIWKKRRTIPLSRIQNVNIERTLWHRVCKSAAVKVETAAGKQAEGDLAALSLADADALQAVLLRNNIHALAEEPNDEPAIFQLPLKKVLLAGMLRNRVVYIVAGMFAVFQHDSSHGLVKIVFDRLEKLDSMMAALWIAVSTVFLIFIGWAVSVAISATRFYGFRIERHERGLLLIHGLITQFRSVVPLGRLQTVRLVEPVLFRLNDYVEVFADTAGSFDQKDHATANMVCPIVSRQNLPAIGELLLPEFQSARLDWKRVSWRTIPRHIFSYLLLFTIILLPLIIGFKIQFAWPIVAPLLLILAITLSIVSYQTVAFAYTNHILYGSRGVLTKQTIMLPFDRIQHFTIRASFFQRLQGLASVQAVSAASNAHAFIIEDIDRAEAETLIETISRAVRSHLGVRQAGL